MICPTHFERCKRMTVLYTSWALLHDVVNMGQVSCQQHAKLLRSGKEEDRAKAKAVELLMEMHPALKVSIRLTD